MSGRARRRAAAAAGLLLLTLPRVALGTDEVEIVDVDLSLAPEVSLIVSLPAEVVAASPGAEDFAVVVNNRRTAADVYALVRDAMEVVVVMDTSGSMEGEAITQAIAAAQGFVDSLPDTAQVAVLAFSDAAVPLTAMGATGEEVRAALAGLAAAGETALYDAVVAAAGLYTGADSRRVMVVLSDGGDTVSASSLEDAVEAVASAGAEVHAVALETSETATGALAELTGGSVAPAAGAADLGEAYAAVALELTGRYRLSFYGGTRGILEVGVFVNGPSGILSATRTIDLATGTIDAGVTTPTAPAGFGSPSAEATPTLGTTDRLDEPWTLPAGVALVFLGAIVTLWLTSRGGRQKDRPFEVPAGIILESAERTGWLASMGSVARDLGDRIASRSREGAIDRALDRAGLNIRPGEFVVVAATGVVVGVTMGLVLGGLFLAVLFGIVAVLAPRYVLRARTEQRRREFGDQLEGTLQTIAGSLRAGYGLVQAISTVASESPAPTSTEFNRVVVENRMGRPVEQAMLAMAERLENEDLRWVVEAIEIQREVGGNLAEILDTVTGTIRDRNLIRRQVKALSAEGRVSAYILLALPFVIAGFIAMISPDYLAELTGTRVGNLLLGAAAVLMFLGAMWIRKLIRVEF